MIKTEREISETPRPDWRHVHSAKRKLEREGPGKGRHQMDRKVKYLKFPLKLWHLNWGGGGGGGEGYFLI